MVRKDWQCLNGLWDYAIVSTNVERTPAFQGEILVPYPVQSALSGVRKTISPEETLWYRRTFSVPPAWKGQRVLLHFDAVDWQTTVWVNGTKVGEHQGGFDAFTYDITGILNEAGPQELLLSVWDPNDAGAIPRGKQVLKPGRTRYTAISGIWQSVWLEPVPQSSIRSLKITPNVDANEISLTVYGQNLESSDLVAVEILDSGRVIAKEQGKANTEIHCQIKNPKLWAPGNPFLYDLKIMLQRRGKAIDHVSSYFGLRKIEIKKDSAGVNRIFLNGQPLFELGLLDQGWWPDGLYTAPTDAALKFDIEETLKMGFNLARKHVKVEPDRWYYWADKLGLLVWQDMPSGDRPWRGEMPATGRRPAIRSADKLLSRETYDIYTREYQSLIENHFNHPCIIMWVPFNEGWGQHDTLRIVELTRHLDPSRLVDNASGWFDMESGDVTDLHKYPGPGMNPLEEKRASVLGEFGGLELLVQGHLWESSQQAGFRNILMANSGDLARHYADLISAVKTYVARGLSAAVYTQTTDCEGEINGLLTYDRINKIGADKIARINRPVYQVKSAPDAALPPVKTPVPIQKPANPPD